MKWMEASIADLYEYENRIRDENHQTRHTNVFSRLSVSMLIIYVKFLGM